MKRSLHYIPTLLAAGLIMYLSLLRELPVEPPLRIPHLDKIVHLLMYWFLAAVLTWDLWRDKREPAFMARLAVLLPSLYGGVIELLQHYCFPPRTGDWYDWAADIIGAFAGAVVTFLILQKSDTNRG